MLNAGRAAVGKAAYKFPPKFTYLTGREQLLMLTNEDRQAYGLPVVVGLNATLQSVANAAAAKGVDPGPVATIGGYAWRAYGSNVFTAINYVANPLFDYFNWMYNDGPGGTNAECHTAPLRNCWIHRHNNLTIYPSGTITVVGVGFGSGHLGSGSVTYPTSGASQLFEAFPNSSKIPSVPTILSLYPASGSHAGGTTVTLNGYGFRSVTKIIICGIPVSSISVKSISTITLTTGRASGKLLCNVVVGTTGGYTTSSGAKRFDYT